MAENAAALKDMAAQLAAILRAQGEKGREAWSQLHGKLAEVASAASGDDTRTAVQGLLNVAKDASPSHALLGTLEQRVAGVNPGLLKDLVLHVAGELNMTPISDSAPVHMVDMDSNFCEVNVDRIVKWSAELSDRDAPYGVVSVVGAQSSGKSFLLNCLFGTKFPVMDPGCKRSQTTRGIMMSRCIGPSLILLDVEGSDGRERGQDTIFEKRAALFALTVSDLMMVNIISMNFGLEHGGSNPLFRTIFEQRTKLPRGITKLLVVLRYYSGEPSLEIMTNDVLETLEKLWRSVNLESDKFEDYIKVDIVGLRDKNLPEFPEEVTALRKQFSNITSAKVPASGFSLSSSRYWDTIKKNKELNIPSHQVAVARLYCQGLVNEIVNSLDSQEKYKLLKAQESPVRFKEISHELLEKITTEYDLNTKKYDAEVRDQEHQNLVEKLQEIFKGDSRELIRKVQENTIKQFQREFDGKNIENMIDANADLPNYVQEFISSFEGEKIFDTDHSRRIGGELKKMLQSYTAQAIKRKANKKTELVKGINLGLSLGLTTLSMVAGLVTGDVVTPILGFSRHICSTAAQQVNQDTPSTSQNHDHDSPSASQDPDCDLSTDWVD